MSSVGRLELFNEAALAASQTGAQKSMEIRWTDIKATLILTNSAAGNFSAIIEHSPDGTNWSTVGTIAAQVGDGVSDIDITGFMYPLVRANVTRVGGTADVSVALFYDKKA